MKTAILIFLFSVAICACNRESSPPVDTNSHAVLQKSTAGDSAIASAPPVLITTGKIIKTNAKPPPITRIQQPSQIKFKPSKSFGVRSQHQKINVPGESPFLMPISEKAKAVHTFPLLTDKVLAKSPHSKDVNPSAFSYYDLRHGLKQATIRAILQDSKGNLWLGSYSGGVSKFDGKYFTHFTTANGLKNDVVFCIHEDREGNLWFGTDGGGVTRYDGQTFAHFDTKGGFISNTVFGISEGKNGVLWFATSDGICSYDGSHFTKYTILQGLGHNMVYSVIVDSEGEIWCATQKGLSRFNGHRFINYTEADGLCNNLVLSLYENNNKQLFIGTLNGLSVFDGQSFSTLTECFNAQQIVIYDLQEDRHGKLWLATQNGLLSFDGKMFVNYTVDDGLINNVVFCIMEDRAGKLWLGTNGGGIVRYDGRAFSFYSKATGLTQNVILSICEDKNNNIWFGSSSNGASRFDGKTLVSYSKLNGLTSNTIYDILAARNGNIWFATDIGGACYFDGMNFFHFQDVEGISNGTVYQILEDKKGKIWFASEKSGALCFDGKHFASYKLEQGLPSNTIYSMLEDKKGNIWFATYEGLSRFDGETFTNYKTEQGMPDNIVYSLFEDSLGYIWLGTNAGLVFFDGENFECFRKQNGLANDAILSITDDDQNNIWLGTRNGISKISLKDLLADDNLPKANLFYNITYDDGFLGVNCRRNSVLKDSGGVIWWGANVLTKFRPSFHEIDTAAPALSITNVKMYGENIPWAKIANVNFSGDDSTLKNRITRYDTTLANGIVLSDIRFTQPSKWTQLPQNLSTPYYNNNFTFEFIGVHLQNSNHIQYKYMLQGLDVDWRSSTKETSANYGNLAPGRYTFKVMAMNQSGIWSEPESFDFFVRTAWWQTRWFKTLVILLLIIATRLYIFWREKETKIVNEKLEKKNQELLKTNAELDRFVYSASHELRGPLTSLLGLINLAKKEEKIPDQKMKLDMMETAVNKLDLFIHDIVDYSKNSHLEFHYERIDPEAIITESILQFQFLPEWKHIVFTTEIDNSFPFDSDKKRLKILLNNLISNAVKYSRAKENESKVHVIFSVDKEHARIVVKDNGVGISPSHYGDIFKMFFRGNNTKAGAGLGLYICKEVVNKLSGTITVSSNSLRETVFEVVVPNNNTNV